jgi:phytoene synthase
LDDLADASALGETEALEQVIHELNPEVVATDPLVLDFLGLASERGLSLQAATLLARALRADCGAREIDSEGELLNFAFGVAGTVGVLMCPVLGVEESNALPFALDLGIALQLTNIARDVVEDAGRKRFYLPRTWVEPGVIENAIAGEVGAIQAVDAAIERLLNLAELFYESAFSGFWFIGARNRRAVFFASMLYREIGRSLLRMESGAWRKRRILSGVEKLKVSMRALRAHRTATTELWSIPHEPKHGVEIIQKYQAAGIPLTTLQRG